MIEKYVSDGCLAALHAASEVIAEKCSIKSQEEEEIVIAERLKKQDKKRKPCWNVMDGLTAVISALVGGVLTEDNTFKLSIEDHDFEVTKMPPKNKEFACFGIGKSYIGPDTWVEDPYQIKSETDIEFIRRELKRVIDAQKENIIKEANMLVIPLKITDFKVGDIRFERFIETKYRTGVIIYDLEVKVKRLKHIP